MRRSRSALCALCLALLVPLAIRAASVLPTDRRPLVEAKYAGWSGVLRLWVCEGWPSGSDGLAGWLNGCIARFEKRRPGVYVQPRSVDPDALAAFADSGILPPDMLLFSPCGVDGPGGLLPIEPPANLRADLRHCGEWGGATYAVPVAMGGYLWAWNAALIDGLPADWREADAALAAPLPEAGRRFDAALLAMCSQGHGTAEPSAPSELPGLDLGLAGDRTPAPAESPTAAVPMRLPEGFAPDGDAFRRFINGEAAATLVTQREVRRLQALSEQGKGPDWRLSAEGGAFTDQLLCLAVVDKPEAHGELCAEFLACLMEDESQAALCAAGAFAVTDAPSGYAAADPLATLDAGLRRTGLATPNCLDRKWPETADLIVRKFLADSGDSPSLWRALATRLAENPNINSKAARNPSGIGPPKTLI